jgi:hypothetical protein
VDELLRALDDAHFLGTRAAVRSNTAKMAEAAWLSASGVSDPRTRAATSSAANRSPVPFGLIGSFGVRTRQALARSTARLSISPPGVSASSALVMTTVPRAMNARAALSS